MMTAFALLQFSNEDEVLEAKATVRKKAQELFESVVVVLAPDAWSGSTALIFNPDVLYHSGKQTLRSANLRGHNRASFVHGEKDEQARRPSLAARRSHVQACFASTNPKVRVRFGQSDGDLGVIAATFTSTWEMLKGMSDLPRHEALSEDAATAAALAVSCLGHSAEKKMQTFVDRVVSAKRKDRRGGLLIGNLISGPEVAAVASTLEGLGSPQMVEMQFCAPLQSALIVFDQVLPSFCRCVSPPLSPASTN